MPAQTPAATLYCIPVPLSDGALHTLTPHAIAVLHGIRHFVVENARTARRFIRSTDPLHAIDTLVISEIGDSTVQEMHALLAPLRTGYDMGLMSEAGCPGIADPGAALVRAAHAEGITVVPLAGPSSILLAMMASGLGGQRFQFHGYLSHKKPQLTKDLMRLQTQAKRDQATQVFIETPYRNRQVIEAALTVLTPHTLLCIAADLTGPGEWIRTMTIGEWKAFSLPDLHKRPCVFCLGM